MNLLFFMNSFFSLNFLGGELTLREENPVPLLKQKEQLQQIVHAPKKIHHIIVNNIEHTLN